MAQLEIEFDKEPKQSTPTLSTISPGTVFRYPGAADVFMKVKSVNFLNNSDLLSDVFSRGDCLAVNLRKGTVSVHKGSKEVIRLRGNLKVKRVQEND